MTTKSSRWLAVPVLVLAVLAPAGARAGGILFHDQGRDPACSRGSYSCIHYHAPSLWRVYACLFLGPVPQQYASDYYAHVPPSFYDYRPPCPYADPSTLYGYPSFVAPVSAPVLIEQPH